MTTPWSLQGKTALVCGASQGIGAATAELFAERGAKVIALARNQSNLDQSLKKLKGEGHQSFAVDLSDLESLKNKIIPELQKQTIHILVNNAGGPKGGPMHKADIQEFMAPLNAHLFASQLLVQALYPKMKEAGYGRILNVISTSVKNPLPNLGVSNTIRGAMASWSKTLAAELAPFNITVNNILPGYIKTGRLDSLMQSAAQSNQTSVEETEEKWKASVPMQRIGEPREMAEAIAFLASPAASYVTGINLPVDGGRTPSL